MRKRLGSVMGIGRRIGLDDEKGVAVAGFSCLSRCWMLLSQVTIFGCATSSRKHITLFICLIAKSKLTIFQKSLVANQNSTFSVYVDVTNHMNKAQDYQVRTKITTSFIVTPQEGVAVAPVNTYDFNLKSGDTYEKSVTLTENTVGTYTVVFELWRLDGSAYVFTQDYCVLNIKVIN